MTKHEEFNRFMKLCRVKTVFIASVTDSIKIKWMPLTSRYECREYAILQPEGFPPIVVRPGDWSELKDKIVVGVPMLFFVNEPTMNDNRHKPDWNNVFMTYPPSFQWLLDDVQPVAMVDNWIKSFVEAVKLCEQTKGRESNDEMSV